MNPELRHIYMSTNTFPAGSKACWKWCGTITHFSCFILYTCRHEVEVIQMIPIKIEATNPGNIGGYKNTPFRDPITPRQHTKPIKGSYKYWIEHPIKESKQRFLEDVNLSSDELVQSAISAILQNEKYRYIAHWVDNDVDTANSLEANNRELYNFIKYRLMGIAEEYYRVHKDKTLDLNTLVCLWQDELCKLNSALKNQYGEVI